MSRHVSVVLESAKEDIAFKNAKSIVSASKKNFSYNQVLNRLRSKKLFLYFCQKIEGNSSEKEEENHLDFKQFHDLISHLGLGNVKNGQVAQRHLPEQISPFYIKRTIRRQAIQTIFNDALKAHETAVFDWDCYTHACEKVAKYVTENEDLTKLASSKESHHHPTLKDQRKDQHASSSIKHQQRKNQQQQQQQQVDGPEEEKEQQQQQQQVPEQEQELQGQQQEQQDKQQQTILQQEPLLTQEHDQNTNEGEQQQQQQQEAATLHHKTKDRRARKDQIAPTVGKSLMKVSRHWESSPLNFVRPRKKSVSPARAHPSVQSESLKHARIEPYLQFDFFNSEVEKDKLSAMTLNRFERTIKNARIVEKVIQDSMQGFKKYEGEIRTIFLQCLPVSQRSKLYEGKLDFESYRQAMSRLKGFLTLRKQLHGTESFQAEEEERVNPETDAEEMRRRAEKEVYMALMKVLVSQGEPQTKRRRSEGARDINKEKFLEVLVDNRLVDDAKVVPSEPDGGIPSWKRRLSMQEAEALCEDLKLCLGSKMLNEGKVSSRICHALSRFLSKTLQREGSNLLEEREMDEKEQEKEEKDHVESHETADAASAPAADKPKHKTEPTIFTTKALNASKNGDTSQLKEEFCRHCLLLVQEECHKQHLPEECFPLVSGFFCDFTLYRKHLPADSQTMSVDGFVNALKEWHQVFFPSAFKRLKVDPNHPRKAPVKEHAVDLQLLKEEGEKLLGELLANGPAEEYDFVDYCRAWRVLLQGFHGKITLQPSPEPNGDESEDRIERASRVLFPAKRYLIAIKVLKDAGVVPKFMTIPRVFEVITISRKKSEGSKPSLRSLFARVAKEVDLQKFALNVERNRWDQFASVVSWNFSYALRPEYQARAILSPWSQKHRIAAVRPRTGIRKILMQQEEFRRQNIQKLLLRKEREQRKLQDQIAKTQEANEKLLVKQLRRKRWTDALEEVDHTCLELKRQEEESLKSLPKLSLLGIVHGLKDTLKRAKQSETNHFVLKEKSRSLAKRLGFPSYGFRL